MLLRNLQILGVTLRALMEYPGSSSAFVTYCLETGATWTILKCSPCLFSCELSRLTLASLLTAFCPAYVL